MSAHGRPWVATGDGVLHRLHTLEFDHVRHLASVEALCGAAGPVQLGGTDMPVNCPACLRKEADR